MNLIKEKIPIIDAHHHFWDLENIYLMSGDKTTFDDNSFDIVIASDCLEHMENDSETLKEWNRIIKPNGKLIIFVPAWKTLWSNLDEMSHHYRRYSYSDLKMKLIDDRSTFNSMIIRTWKKMIFILCNETQFKLNLLTI